MTVERLNASMEAFAGMRMLETAAKRQMAFCGEIEAIADELPSIAADRLAWLVARLREHGAGLADLEETTLFPLLERHFAEDPCLKPAIAQARQDHECDADLAVELAETLETVRKTGAPKNPSALGFLMRHYFEQRRRHLAWEAAVLIGPARSLLTADERVDLTRRMSIRALAV